MANYFKKSIIILPYQMSKIDQFDENNIKKFLNKTVHNQEQMISKSEELSKIMIYINNTEYNLEDNNSVRALKLIYRKMAIKKELFSPIERDQIRGNLQAQVLYNMIKKCLLLNYF